MQWLQLKAWQSGIKGDHESVTASTFSLRRYLVLRICVILVWQNVTEMQAAGVRGSAQLACILTLYSHFTRNTWHLRCYKMRRSSASLSSLHGLTTLLLGYVYAKLCLCTVFFRTVKGIGILILCPTIYMIVALTPHCCTVQWNVHFACVNCYICGNFS